MWAFLQYFLTPHHTNNHRPKALHPQLFIFYITLFLFLQVSLSNLRLLLPNVLGLATDINAERLVNLTNQKRAERGLAPLKLDPQLSQAAAGKAQDMFTKDYWAHNSPGGLTPWVFIKDAKYSYLYAGENLAKNFANSEGVVDAWMASPSHRANLLKPEYKDIGFAVVNGRLGSEETTLVVQMFGTKQAMEIAAKQGSSLNTPAIPLTPSPAKILAPTQNAEIASSTKERVVPVILASTNRPVFDIFSLTKAFSLALTGFLVFILMLDALLVWRRKTVRIAGHNFAHIFFLLSIVGVIWLSRPGIIH